MTKRIPFSIILAKKHGKRLLGLLLYTKACSRKSVRAVLVDDAVHICVPNTRMVEAVFFAYICGRGIGYSLGCPMPKRGIGTILFPRKST